MAISFEQALIDVWRQVLVEDVRIVALAACGESQKCGFVT